MELKEVSKVANGETKIGDTTIWGERGETERCKLNSHSAYQKVNHLG